MSTAGHDVPLRWIDDAPRARRRAPVLIAIAIALLCPATFAGFFVVGRAAVPTPTSPQPTAPNLPIVYAGAPIPARLGDAPPLDAIGAQHTAAPSQHAAGAGTTKSGGVSLSGSG